MFKLSEKPVFVIRMPDYLIHLVGTKDVEMWVESTGEVSSIRSDKGSFFPNVMPKHKEEKTGKWWVKYEGNVIILQEKKLFS